MTDQSLSMTEVAQIAQRQRTLALKQQDSSLLAGFPHAPEDDSHLDLTARIRFLEACGGMPPFSLERIDESGNVDRYGFERPFLLVGRSAACDVACRVRSVSFRHLYLQYLDGVVWWFDLDSRTGSLCDGKKRRAGCLMPGMTLNVGEQSLRLVSQSADKVATEDATEGANGQRHSRSQSLSVSHGGDLPEVYLRFENGRVKADGEEEKRFKVENAVTLLGRRSCCDVRFSDDSVSRVHSSLVLTQDGLWIVDLLGRGGTRVNGNLSAYAYLHEDSLIEIGNYKIRVHYKSHGQPHPAEAVLDAEAKQPKFASNSGGGGGVSEELLYTLVNNMAQMQKQMFDQSQQQVGMLIQMLGSFHQSQHDLLREELARVHEISREMREIQSKLGLEAPGARPRAANSPEELAESPELQAIAFEMGQSEAGENDPLPAPSLFPIGEPPSPTSEQNSPAVPEAPENGNNPNRAEPRANSNEVHEHALLFQRMQSLDRERNSRFQKILRAITGAG